MKNRSPGVKLASLCVSLIVVLSFVFACAKPAPSPTPTPAAKPAPAPAKPAPAPAVKPAPSPAVTAKPKPAPSPAPAPKPAAAKQWRMHSFYAPADPLTALQKSFFIPRVKELSKGTIDIALFPGATIVPANDALQAVGKGVVDMAFTTMTYHVGLTGPMGYLAAGAPYMWRTYQDAKTLWSDKGLGKIITDSFAKHDAQVVAPARGSTGHWLISKVPIRTVADMKGVKIRSIGDLAKLYDKLGAKSVFTPLGEVYTALATGTVDAVTYGSPSQAEPVGIYEVAKYHIEPAWVRAGINVYIMNKKLWDSLTADQKKALETAFQELNDKQAAAGDVDDAAAVKKVVAKGITVLTLSDADQKEIARKAEELWTATAGNDPTALGVLKIIKDYMKEKGYM